MESKFILRDGLYKLVHTTNNFQNNPLVNSERFGLEADSRLKKLEILVSGAFIMPNLLKKVNRFLVIVFALFSIFWLIVTIKNLHTQSEKRHDLRKFSLRSKHIEESKHHKHKEVIFCELLDDAEDRMSCKYLGKQFRRIKVIQQKMAENKENDSSEVVDKEKEDKVGDLSVQTPIIPESHLINETTPEMLDNEKEIEEEPVKPKKRHQPQHRQFSDSSQDEYPSFVPVQQNKGYQAEEEDSWDESPSVLRPPTHHQHTNKPKHHNHNKNRQDYNQNTFLDNTQRYNYGEQAYGYNDEEDDKYQRNQVKNREIDEWRKQQEIEKEQKRTQREQRRIEREQLEQQQRAQREQMEEQQRLQKQLEEQQRLEEEMEQQRIQNQLQEQQKHQRKHKNRYKHHAPQNNLYNDQEDEDDEEELFQAPPPQQYNNYYHQPAKPNNDYYNTYQYKQEQPSYGRQAQKPRQYTHRYPSYNERYLSEVENIINPAKMTDSIIHINDNYYLLSEPILNEYQSFYITVFSILLSIIVILQFSTWIIEGNVEVALNRKYRFILAAENEKSPVVKIYMIDDYTFLEVKIGNTFENVDDSNLKSEDEEYRHPYNENKHLTSNYMGNNGSSLDISMSSLKHLTHEDNEDKSFILEVK